MDPILPTAYPVLAYLCWFRDPSVLLEPEEAWCLYRDGWRHVDPERLLAAERDLVQALADRYGAGRLPDATPPWARGRPT